MSENFVAIGRGSLYPEYRGGKVMAETAVPPPEDTHRTVPETKPERTAEEIKRQKAEAEKRARQEAREKEETAQNPPIEISFREAQKIAEVVTNLQAEKKVIISPKELADFKKVLAKSGYQPKAIDKMTDAQIVLAAQQILKNAKIIQAKESDWKYAPKSPNRKAEEALVREQIAKAQSFDEEQLTPEKVAQFLEVEEFAKAAEGGGPGTMEAGPGDRRDDLQREMQLREIDFRETTRETIARLKLLARRRLVGDELTEEQQQEWELRLNELGETINEFDTAVREKRFLKVYDFVTIIDDAVYTSENYEPPLPDGRQATHVLDSFLAPVERQRFERELRRLDEDFEKVYMKMDDRVRKIILEDLELSLGTQLGGLIAGWNKPENVRNYIFGGKYDEYDNQGTLLRRGVETSGIVHKVSRVVEESLDEEMVGIREWRGAKEIYGVEERVTIELLTQPPLMWQEVPERITAIYRFIERTDFTVEQLQEYIGKAVRMIESIKTDDPEGRRILNELNAELKAFQAFHSFRVTLERTSMDPEQVTSVFQNYFDDRTWVNFARRFAHDSRLRDFTGAGKEGKTIKVNLLDEAWKLYMKQLEDDRVRMNAIGKWTRDGEEIDLNNLDKYSEDQLWIILALAHRRDFEDYANFFNKLALETKEDYIKAMNNLSEDRKKLLGVWGLDLGQDNSRTQFVIMDWLRRRTLVGAYGTAMEGVEKDEQGRRKLDQNGDPIKFELNLLAIRREQMRKLLSERLKELELGVEGQEDTEKLLKGLDQQGFLDAVDANVYQLAWTLAWSDFDIIRIYGVDRKTGKRSNIPQAIAYNQSTKMFFGREIDHFMDFIIDEERGRPYEVEEVNALFRKHLLGEHGNLLPQNRTMVRFARNFMTPKQQIEVEKRAQELMRFHNFVPAAGYNELLEKDLDQERIDHPENPQRDPYFEGFLGWARSAAIAEMIDSGELGTKDEIFSFSQKDFSAAAPFISQYSMIDLYGDRTAAKKYFDRKNLQGYMRDPSNERFLAINDKDSEFYSGRNVRLQPHMNIVFEAHWEIAHKHWKKLLNIDNLQSGGGEALVELLVLNGVMRKQQGENLKRRMFGFAPGVLGTVPFRRIRQYTDFTALAIWEDIKSPGFYLGSIWDFLKRLFTYVAGGFGGK